MAEVSLQKATYSDPGIEELLGPLGGMKCFVEAGERVLLKVNLLSARSPEKAVTTHPEFIRAVAREVKRVGGKPFIGDSPSGPFSKKNLIKVYRKTGIEALANEEGIPLNFDTDSRKVDIPNGKKLTLSPICNYALDADKVIAIPKLKTHGFQYMTLACKIMYGAVPGLIKAKYHALFRNNEAFADMLIDLFEILKPQLFIMDGILGMQGQGPGSGEPVELGLALASTDAVAMDMALCAMMGIDPIGIPTLKRAKIRKMWPDVIEYPLLKPEDHLIKEFKLPNTAMHLVTGKKASKKSPIITDRCIGCGECEKICPVGAAVVAGEVTTVNYSKCIRCFCCHEVCPEDAITLGKVKRARRENKR